MMALIARYQQLLLAIEITASRASVVLRCHDYKKVVEKHVRWLTETEEKVREDEPLDSLDSVCILLDELQVGCLLVPHPLQFVV